MRLLLDTHVFLWWLADDERIGPATRHNLADPNNLVWVSAASIWEMAIKLGSGKLAIVQLEETALAELIPRAGFSELPVTARHAAAVASLPRHHSDPFDRLLIAQAKLEQATLVTADRALVDYAVDRREP